MCHVSCCWHFGINWMLSAQCTKPKFLFLSRLQDRVVQLFRQEMWHRIWPNSNPNNSRMLLEFIYWIVPMGRFFPEALWFWYCENLVKRLTVMIVLTIPKWIEVFNSCSSRNTRLAYKYSNCSARSYFHENSLFAKWGRQDACCSPSHSRAYI